jgi:hypothetical protein
MQVEEYKPTKKEINARKLAQDAYKRAKVYQTPIFDKFLRYYFLYRNVQEEEQWPFRNNIFVPVIFSIIETLIPRVVLNQPKITLLPREKGDDKFIEPSKTLVDYRWGQTEMFIELVDLFKQCFIYGTAPIKGRWIKEKRKVPRRNVLGKLIFGKYKTITESYPEFETVDQFSFFIDPDADRIKKAKYVIHKIYLSEEEIKENREGIYKNLQCVEGKKIDDNYIGERWRIHDLSNKQRGRILTSSGGGSGSEKPIEEKFVEVREHYFRSSKKYPLGRLIVLANDNIVLKDDINPYWYLDGEFPFIEVKDQPVPKEFWAIGEIEPIEGLQYERNHIRNRRMDSAEQTMDKMWRIDPDSEVDENELVWQPSGIIHAKAGEVEIFEAGPASPSGYQEEDIVKQDIQVTSGISDFTRGQVAKGFSETYGGILTLINEANQRFALKIKLIGEMGIKRIVKMLLQMEEYNAEKKRTIRITGEKGHQFKPIKPEQIKSNLDIKVEIDPWPLINKAYQREQITAVCKMLGKDPDVNQKKLKEMLLSAFDVQNKEEILTPEIKTEEIKGRTETLPSIIPLMPKEAGTGMLPKTPAVSAEVPLVAEKTAGETAEVLPKSIPLIPKEK